MATELRLRRGTDTQNDAFTGAEGEITVDTTKKQLRLHDGVTAGGRVIGAASATEIAYSNGNSGLEAENVQEAIDILAAGEGTGARYGLDAMDAETLVYIPHRGAMLRNPECTVVGYRASVASGAKFLEIDVRLTSDGVPVIMHDATVDRTTNGTGNVADKTIVDWQALSVDSGTVLRGGWGNYPAPTLREVIEEFGNKILMIVEAKVASAGKAIVALLQEHNIAPDMVLVCSGLADELTAAHLAGFSTCLLFEAYTGAPTPATLVASGYRRIGVEKSTSTAQMDALRSAGLKVDVYTIDRRSDLAPLLDHIDGVYTNDDVYLSGRVTAQTQDPFALAMWWPGALSVDDSLSDSVRGSFYPGGYWGFGNPTGEQQGDVYMSRPVLQGWACPIGGNAQADTFTIEYTVRYEASVTDTRWPSLYINDGSRLDAAIVDQATSPTEERVINFYTRFNGEMNIATRIGTTVTALAVDTGTAITNGEEVRFRVDVTPTTLTYSRLDVDGDVVQAVSSNNTDVRGGYIYFAISGCQAQFRDVVITPG